MNTDLYTCEIKIEKQIEECVKTFRETYNCKDNLMVYVRPIYARKITKTFIKGLKADGVTLVWYERIPEDINVVVQKEYKLAEPQNANTVRIKPWDILED